MIRNKGYKAQGLRNLLQTNNWAISPGNVSVPTRQWYILGGVIIFILLLLLSMTDKHSGVNHAVCNIMNYQRQEAANKCFSYIESICISLEGLEKKYLIIQLLCFLTEVTSWYAAKVIGWNKWESLNNPVMVGHNWCSIILRQPMLFTSKQHVPAQ